MIAGESTNHQTGSTEVRTSGSSPHGAVALVTGGGTGIGRATARSLAGAGWRVAVCGRRRDPLTEVLGSLPDEGSLAVQADIADPSQVERLVSRVVEEFGALDLLVNNAAVAVPGPLTEVDLIAVEEMVRINLLGTILVTREAIPHLARRPGNIVNIGSVGGRSASLVSSVYGATKAAVHHLTNCLAVELAPLGIRVNTIAPGPVQTDIGDSSSLLEELGKATLRERAGRPEEIASWVLQLASSTADWVTGTTIAVDGGAGVRRDYLG